MRNIAGFQQTTDSLPSTAKYGESSLGSRLPFLPQDKPYRQASSGVSSSYTYAGSTPNSEELYKPCTTEQDSASRYQSQYSVPFGEQEQSSPKDQSSSNQSLPNSFSTTTDLPQSSSNGMSIPTTTIQGTSRDSGQDNVQNGALDNTGPTRRGRSWTDGTIADTRSDRHQRISQPSAEKVPVERVLSNDYHDVAAQHLINKCPVEMNYDSVSKYFNSGGKNLGQGGFGIVYEGKIVKYIHAHVSANNATKAVRKVA